MLTRTQLAKHVDALATEYANLAVRLDKLATDSFRATTTARLKDLARQAYAACGELEAEAKELTPNIPEPA